MHVMTLAVGARATVSSVTVTFTHEYEFDLNALIALEPEAWEEFVASYQGEEPDPQEFVAECLDSWSMLTSTRVSQGGFTVVTRYGDVDVDVRL